MKNIFTKGDTKQYSKIVLPTEVAAFESGVVHHVYSSFCLAKDAEWCSRLFVLDMKETHEEGIGTKIHVNHVSPALVGQEVTIITTFDGITDKQEILTSFTAYVGERIIATGVQGQKILPKEKLLQLFKHITN